MTSIGKLVVAGVLLGLATTLAAAQAPDVPGSKDHPLITRYPGCVIDAYRSREYDEYVFPLGKLTGTTLEKSQELEGKVTRIHYFCPRGRSLLEVYRNYEAGLKRAGFEPLFTCSGEACGNGSFQFSAEPNYGWWTGARHVSGKLARPEGDVYVSLHVQEGDAVNVLLDIIEMKPMETGLVTVDAAALANEIARTGHASVYGIYFDTGKDIVKPESEPALTEVAKLLQQNPTLKLHVVGHTDNVGDLAMNMDLSRRRANAVVQALTTQHGVTGSRLRADGVGPYAPVASNKTEEGRAKNRRVELVEQ